MNTERQQQWNRQAGQDKRLATDELHNKRKGRRLRNALALFFNYTVLATSASCNTLEKFNPLSKARWFSHAGIVKVFLTDLVFLAKSTSDLINVAKAFSPNPFSPLTSVAVGGCIPSSSNPKIYNAIASVAPDRISSIESPYVVHPSKSGNSARIHV